MTTSFLIYGLIDPRSGELRYVGKSSRGLARPKMHVHAGQLGKDFTYKAHWLRQLLAAGLKPDIEVLETHETHEALVEAEKHFIAYFRGIGCRLTNIADGGQGGATTRGRKHSPETKAKIAARALGRPIAPKSAAGLARISLANSRPHPWVLRRAKAVMDESGVVYASAQAAARALDLDVRMVSRAARHFDRKWTAGGHTFQYAEAVCS